MDATTHRSLAISTYNQMQQLLDAHPSPAEQDELLTLAFTSRYHWQQVGGDQEHAIADWAVSRAALACGYKVLGLRFAQNGAARAASSFPAWLRASLLEGVARAHHVAGDVAQRNEFVRQARVVLAEERDADDAAIIEAQLAELTEGA